MVTLMVTLMVTVMVTEGATVEHESNVVAMVFSLQFDVLLCHTICVLEMQVSAHPDGRTTCMTEEPNI